MGNIVVGIDFSENSINSLKHAVAITLKTGATLHLVWVKTAGITKGLAKENKNDFVQMANEELNLLMEECKREASKAKVQSVIVEGKPFMELTKYATNLKKSLIIIGTHGVSGFEKNFIGSNAFKTVAASPVPVMVLREGVKIKRDLTQIVVPVDVSFDTLQKVKVAAEFAKSFSAKILLAGFYEKNNQQQEHIVDIQLKHAETICAKANIRNDREMVPFKEHISDAIVQYGKEKDANLIVIMREGDIIDDISNLWLGNTTQQLLTKSPIPLLIVPNVDYISVAK